MIPWIGTVVAALLALGALCSPSIAWAKPSDLPGDVTQQCPEGRDGRQAEGFPTRPSDLGPQIIAPTPNDLQARHLFDIAERCRAAGDLDKARTCYEEAHLLSPASPHGRLAIDRLWELDRARLNNNADAADAAEEQDAPPLRRLHREPTERRSGAELEPTPRPREINRSSVDDPRRMEMLRSTQPLETRPQSPLLDDEALREDGLQSIQYYEVPPAFFSGLSSQAPCVQRTNFPWDGWRARLFHGMLWYEWIQPCIVEQQFTERIRGFMDHEGAATGLSFTKQETVTSRAIAASIGPAPSASYLPPISMFSKQPILLVVYPIEDQAAPAELKPASAPGIQGDFDLSPGFIF